MDDGPVDKANAEFETNKTLRIRKGFKKDKRIIEMKSAFV